MDAFEKVAGHCQLRNVSVDILYVKLKKSKGKAGGKTPLRCQSSGECPRNSFCKFVNPLTNHIPVDFPADQEKTAEAS